MRSRITTFLLVAAPLLLLAGRAQAAIILEMELLGSPGVTTAAAGSNVDIAIFLSVGSEGLSDLRYDVVTTAGVAVAGVNQPPPGFCGGIGSCPPPVPNGDRLDGFNLTRTGPGSVAGPVQIGVARFNFAGPDTVSIVYTFAFDEAIPAQPISPAISTTFRIVPEPAVASLLGLALGALALAGRRARHLRSGTIAFGSR